MVKNTPLLSTAERAELKYIQFDQMSSLGSVVVDFKTLVLNLNPERFRHMGLEVGGRKTFKQLVKGNIGLIRNNEK